MGLGQYDVIGVSGYGNSGASAVMDLLMGSDELQVSKGEWQILHQVDGILDLKHYLVECRDKIASNTALSRFEQSLHDFRALQIRKSVRDEYIRLSEDYLGDLVLCSWSGYSAFDGNNIQGIEKNVIGRKIGRVLEKIAELGRIDFAFPLSKERRFSIMTAEQFELITANYLDSIFSAHGYNPNKPLVLEQFFVFSNPTAGSEFFKNSKTILVERDPRDVYASSKFTAKDGAPKKICRFLPTEKVEDFVKYYKSLHIGIKPNSTVMTVKFENLIYEYESEVKRICNFIGLTSQAGLDTYFHPDISINNTKFYKNFPSIKEDIKYIENELYEYINPLVD